MKIEGKVIRIFYHNNRNYFTTMLVHSGKETISCSGTFPIIYHRANITLYGNYKMHKKYGKQFVVDSYDLKEPETTTEMVDLLCSEIVKCDVLIAYDIARNIGLEYLEKYKNVTDIESLLTPRLGLKNNLERNAFSLEKFFTRKKNLKELLLMGFTPELASKIAFSDYPLDINVVKSNPYTLIHPFDIDWKIIDKIAENIGFKKSNHIRLKEGICHLLDVATEKYAHMFVPQTILENVAEKFLGIKTDYNLILNELEENKRIVRDIKDRIYSEENYRLEKMLAENLYRIHNGTAKNKVRATLFDGSFPYSNDQKEAIEMSIKNPVSIISGPAGTGKTTIILKMIEELNRLGYKIELCAPTGRAAKRMREVTGMEAKTIHHLLLFEPFTKKPFFNRNNPLRKNCYILDESSMADLKVLSYLLDAIPDNSKVIILGDIHQLPSIGPGKVLEDLITFSDFPVKELEEVFRQSQNSYLLDVATKIRNGEKVDLRAIPKKSDVRFLSYDSQKKIKESLGNLLEKFMKTKFNIFDDLQIVSPIHKGMLGTKELNSFVQDIVNPNIKNELVYGNKIFRVGDKVIQTKNNYDKEIFNGDIGRIQTIIPKEKYISVNYNGKIVEYHYEEIFEIDLAYVLTVHKVQGGEYPFVIFPIHECFGDFMLNRKLLYTAVTRAKRQLICIGSNEAFQKSIENNEVTARNCNLKGRLKEARLKMLFEKSSYS